MFFATYYFIGWYVKHVGLSENIRKIIYALGLMCVISIIVVEQFTRTLSMYSSYNIVVLIYAVSVFTFCSYNYKGSDNKNKIILHFSKHTFGIYLIHPLILYLFDKFIPCNIFIPAYILIEWLVCLSVSYLISYILSKIPVLKKLVRG